MKECHLLEHKNDFTKLNVSTTKMGMYAHIFNWIQTSSYSSTKRSVSPSNAMAPNGDGFFARFFSISAWLSLHFVILLSQISPLQHPQSIFYCDWIEHNIPNKKVRAIHSPFCLRFIDLVKYFQEILPNAFQQRFVERKSNGRARARNGPRNVRNAANQRQCWNFLDSLLHMMHTASAQTLHIVYALPFAFLFSILICYSHLIKHCQPPVKQTRKQDSRAEMRFSIATLVRARSLPVSPPCTRILFLE